MIIDSKENSKIKYLNKLRSTKYMNQEKKFVIEGKHLVEEAFLSGVLLETFSTFDTNYNIKNNIVSDKIMQYISTLPSKSSIVGICKFIEEKENLGDKVIILDDVQDPGNLGTIIRSAKAFNIDTIVLSLNSVKKYNEKVIRSARGMLFKVNVIVRNLNEFIPYLKENNYMVYGTDVDNGINLNSVLKTGKLAVIMGNEGQGIEKSIKNMIDKNIYIDINEDCESLNVAVATSIIMYEINRRD